MKKIKAAILLVAILAIVAVPVAAAPAIQENPSTLQDFLVWLTGAGAVIAVSWVFEQTGWFQEMPSEQKRWVMYGLSAVVGILALVVQQYVPASVLEMLEPYFGVLLGVFGMIFVNQAAHVLDPRRKV